MSVTEVKETPNIEEQQKPANKRRQWPWILLGIVMILALGGLGAFLGYQQGIAQRLGKQTEIVQVEASRQYNYALADIAAGRNQTAIDRLQYVLQLNPGFPGAADRLGEVMLTVNLEKTPTVAPTPTIAITPTPDTRGEEEMFTQARQHINNKEWDLAIESIESLRKLNLNYNAIKADGMYYIALRNRGVQKILQEGNLEGGIYDLAVAERFGPLDSDAVSYRTWARMYLTGASFWKLDWGQVIYYFSQVAPAFPSLRDGSGLTATERYRRASLEYGKQLSAEEDWCKAAENLTVALSMGSDQETVDLTSKANYECEQSQITPTVEPATGTPTIDPNVTPLPTGEGTPAPGSEPTAEATIQPEAVTPEPQATPIP